MPHTLTRRVIRALLIALVATIIVGIVLHTVTVYTSITYAQIGEWTLKGFAPIGALWVVAERKIGTWKKEAETARAKLAEEETARGAALLKAQESTVLERQRVHETLSTLSERVERIGTQVQKLVDDETNNDGSTKRDRMDLMFSTVHSISNLMASTTTTAMWWGSVDAKGNIIPTKVSDKFHRLTGMSHEQTAHGGWMNFVHIDDQVRVQEIVEGAYRRGKPAQTDFRNVNIVTEEEKTVRLYVSPSCNPQTHKVIGWTWELYELSDPAVHMHRRASDAPVREVRG